MAAATLGREKKGEELPTLILLFSCLPDGKKRNHSVNILHSLTGEIEKEEDVKHFEHNGAIILLRFETHFSRAFKSLK